MTRPGLAPEPVLIVGGGPVGLFLGCCLAQRGVPCRVLERALTPSAHSRSIGVHPPALERLEALGLAEAFVAAGVQIRRGRAYAGRAYLGALEFATCPPPYRFVLTLPQSRTEALLAERLEALAPGALERGAEIVGLEQDSEGVSASVRQDGTTSARRARALVAADGKRSFVRGALAVPFRGSRYPDTYLMGDVADTTDLGTDAALYFTRAGLVESFPLPGGVRRWVVKTPDFVKDATPEGLEQLVWERVGARAPAETNTMLSAFGVQRFLAARFACGRVALLGDAAHVLSPIGGQGMNLGWLSAWALAEALSKTPDDPAGAIERYSRARRRAARAAILRAEFNTVMGRATPLAPLRDGFAWGVLHSPLRRTFAHAFTMRGL